MSIAMEYGPRQHRITVEEFHRMAEVGLLAPDARVELIEGVIIDMAPVGLKHAAACDWLLERLVLATLGRALVRCQGPVGLNAATEPLPDFALLKVREDRYARCHPGGPDTLLIIEISDSTLRHDLVDKVPLYARHGVPEVWIVNVAHRMMHFYRSRTDVGYAEVTSTGAPGVTLLPVSDGSVAVIDLSELFRY